MRVLVTNDDGIDSEGLQVLARRLHEVGHDVLVVAPDRDWSGASAGLGVMRSDERRGSEATDIEVQRVEIEGLTAPAWALAAPPGMTVVAARLEAFGPPPDAVVSGINAGLNTGRAILHSGTVGACLAGQNFGLSGLAVSVAATPDGVWPWATAADLAVEVLERLQDAPPRSVLNLNVPGRPRDEVAGVRWGRLAPFGAARAAVAGLDSGRLQLELQASDYEPEPDTDQGLVQAGYASLTTLVGVAEAWPPDQEIEDPGELVERVVPGADLHPVHRVPDGAEHRSLRRPDLGTG